MVDRSRSPFRFRLQPMNFIHQYPERQESDPILTKSNQNLMSNIIFPQGFTHSLVSRLQHFAMIRRGDE